MAIRSIDVDLIPKIRKIDVFARQSSLSELIEGNYTAAFKGHGMEFSGYRSYTYGDDASIIDWKASLRSKSLLVKEYEVERSVNVYFLLDVSNSMLFASQKKLKVEYAAELVSELSFAILRAGDAVGMSMFTDRLITNLPLNTGRKMHYLIINDLLNINNYGGNFDFGGMAKRFMGVMKQKAVLIIVSDFIGLDDQWKKYLRILSKKYEVIGIMIRDPRDRMLPKNAGQFLLEDPYTGEKIYIDTEAYADAYKKYVEKEEDAIAREFKATKSDFVKIVTNEDSHKIIAEFFKRRALTHR